MTLADKGAREAQHNRLVALRERLLAIVSVEFCLHVRANSASSNSSGDEHPAEEAQDTVTVRSGGAEVDDAADAAVREAVGDMLRTLVVEPWFATDSELAFVRGSFECFIPGHGTNLGWHQDGWSPGCYLMHYYLDRWHDEAVTGGHWLEVALPQPAACASPTEACAGKRGDRCVAHQDDPCACACASMQIPRCRFCFS